ncbi:MULTISPECIES: phytoene desaturase family protein [Halobacterium]|uniref:phytoene desaturase family protein n=1 Tax=Halobacterium TaxID=2239 RepID=UPI0019658C97|nr:MULTISPECIES: phytoene desaturase family protein [Halobacterium]MCF2164791.1 phytoene desaturase [Halobacterium salinarum]MCF2168584.1 phytoene desaturase [Halobacterium salinarum]MCF2239237.1 phytoene desaturase [Halobacterium salinarum]MDL0133135.1 phytoene desaturase family protein [Halobacterium salinarum]QRY22041.1 phytoene desaturase [Halobacterium sp. GSL-19]
MQGSLPGERDVTVVGGGFGGLAAAAYLARAGASVTLLEQHDTVGGRAGVLERDGFRFDTGPSWYLMPDVFERFFDHFDHDPHDFYELTRLDPQYRVFWTDGDSATIEPNRRNAHELFESYEEGAGDALATYLDRAATNYDLAMNRVVYPDRTAFRDYASTDMLPLASRLRLFGNMDDYVSRFFDHPKLRQLLEYTLVFLGGAPHNTPALYSIMSHVDLNGNVFYPEGGIAGVVDALAELAVEQGATIETGVGVNAISGRRGEFTLATDDGTRTTDLVVNNANPAYAERELLDTGGRDHAPDYWDDQTYAPSALMFYLGVEGDVGPLAHHSLVLPPDWDGHFARLFDDPGWPDDPAFYLSVASKTDDTVAPDGHEAVVILLPIAPGLDDTPEIRAQYRDRLLGTLAAQTGVDLRDRIVVEESACVSEFSEQFGDPGGTALGLAHTLFQTGPLRPGKRDGPDGHYYVGAYTNPGIGMPMCLISGEHVTKAVIDDDPAASGSTDPLAVPGEFNFDTPTTAD